MGLLFVFLDGVGLARASDDNPLAHAATPVLHALLGGPLTLEHLQQHDRLLLAAIDATLGVSGLPQSGTGQTAMLAGFNAAALHGRHQPHVPPVALQPRLAAESIFRRTLLTGGSTAFANVFGPGYAAAVATRRIRRSASVIAAEGAGVRLRDLEDLRHGAAVPYDITGAAAGGRPGELPLLSPASAGAVLAGLTASYDLVFFECPLPDLSAHGRTSLARAPGTPRVRDPQQVAATFTTIDRMLGELLAQLRPQDTLLITSDHGNCESIAASGHTRNPVPLLVVGARAAAFATVTSIMELADIIAPWPAA